MTKLSANQPRHEKFPVRSEPSFVLQKYLLEGKLKRCKHHWLRLVTPTKEYPACCYLQCLIVQLTKWMLVMDTKFLFQTEEQRDNKGV